MDTVVQGNTVRLKAEFKTFAGVHIDPVGPSLKIYDGEQALLATIIIDDTCKTATGEYEYDYVIPTTGRDPLVYEWSGTLEGHIAIGRGKLYRKWVS